MYRNERRKKLVKSCFLLISGGVLYACFVKVTGIGVPCLFHLVTGLQCPGCGISRMLLCLLKGDFPGAFWANPFLLATLPFLAFEIIYSFLLQWNSRKNPRWNSILLCVYLAALLLFGIIRNLYPLSVPGSF